MKNSAFAVDPCPRDLLGKQLLFMHMSSHYRRMCSAQSVVDSAPPACLRTRAAPRSASTGARGPAPPHPELDIPPVPVPPGPARRPRPHTAVGHYADGSLTPSTAPATPRATSACSSTKPGRRAHPLHVPVAQQVLQRQSVQTERTQPRLSQRPSRADTDPGPRTGTAGLASKGLEGRASAASAASAATRRQYEYNASVLRKPPSIARHWRRDVEKQGTYYDKLNQLVPDHGPQRSGMRTSGQILSEVFTPQVPHKPQVLRTEVQSRLRFSNTYCPPRSKSNRTKTGVAGQHMSKDTEQSVWLQAQTSPPVSSRDSAYNGGISSGGESRGPTPDHKAGAKKQTKKAERKSKRASDHKQTHIADVKPHWKFENKLVNKLLEEERNEIQEQRLQVDPWHGISQDDHGDEILRNIENLHIESNEEYSSIEHGSLKRSLSNQSIEEDMLEEDNESVDELTNKEGDIDDSLIQDLGSASTKSVEIPSSKKSLTSQKKEESRTQESSSFRNNNSQGHPVENMKQHCNTSSQSVSSSNGSEKYLSSHHSTSRQQADSTPPPELEISETDSKGLHQPISEETKENSESQGEDQQKCGTEPSNSFTKSNQNMSYAKFRYYLTEELAQKHIVTDKGLKAVSDEHIQRNLDKLDKEKMQEEVKKLSIELEIQNFHTYEGTLLRAPCDVTNLTPLTSGPSEIVNQHLEPIKHSFLGVKDFENEARVQKLLMSGASEIVNQQKPELESTKHSFLGIKDFEIESREQKLLSSGASDIVNQQNPELKSTKHSFLGDKDFEIEARVQKLLTSGASEIVNQQKPELESTKHSFLGVKDFEIEARVQKLLTSGASEIVNQQKPELESTKHSFLGVKDFEIEARVQKLYEENLLYGKENKMASSFLYSLEPGELIKISSPTVHSSTNAMKSHISDLMAKDKNTTQKNCSHTSPVIETRPSYKDVEDIKLTSYLAPSGLLDSWRRDPKLYSHADMDQNYRCEIQNIPDNTETPLVVLYSGKNSPSINGSQFKGGMTTEEQNLPSINSSKLKSEITTDEQSPQSINSSLLKSESTTDEHDPEKEDLPMGTGTNSDVQIYLHRLQGPLKGPV